MSNVHCESCSFVNSSISAYCARCGAALPQDSHSFTQPPQSSQEPATMAPSPPATQPGVGPSASELAAKASTAEDSLPSQAPVQAQAKQGDGVTVYQAPIWRQLAATAIDFAIPVLCGLGFAMLEAAIFGRHFKAYGVSFLDVAAQWLFHYGAFGVHGVLVALVIGIVISVELPRRVGTTPGRYVTRTLLLKSSGKPLETSELVLREALCLLSLGLFGAGFFWAVLDKKGRYLHDTLMKTGLFVQRGGAH